MAVRTGQWLPYGDGLPLILVGVGRLRNRTHISERDDFMTQAQPARTGAQVVGLTLLRDEILLDTVYWHTLKSDGPFSISTSRLPFMVSSPQ